MRQSLAEQASGDAKSSRNQNLTVEDLVGWIMDTAHSWVPRFPGVRSLLACINPQTGLNDIFSGSDLQRACLLGWAQGFLSQRSQGDPQDAQIASLRPEITRLSGGEPR